MWTETDTLKESALWKQRPIQVFREQQQQQKKKTKKPAKNFQQWPKTKRKAWNKFLP